MMSSLTCSFAPAKEEEGEAAGEAGSRGVGREEEEFGETGPPDPNGSSRSSSSAGRSLARNQNSDPVRMEDRSMGQITRDIE